MRKATHHRVLFSRKVHKGKRGDRDRGADWRLPRAGVGAGLRRPLPSRTGALPSQVSCP